MLNRGVRVFGARANRDHDFGTDGSKLAVGHDTSPYVTIYNTADWSKITDPAVLPTGPGWGVAFIPQTDKWA